MKAEGAVFVCITDLGGRKKRKKKEAAKTRCCESYNRSMSIVKAKQYGEHGAANRNKNPTSTSDCMRIRKCLCTEPDKQESATINQPDP
jgi:hypothetical protein